MYIVKQIMHFFVENVIN
ncbi:hypothetical protein MTR67_053145 [Solanum verrucosum]|uniref:Uncharacterized protein n=1 Tax=Solanum verrucosum TaxID=315347 RepID=A0AAF0V865_SOLVR|nr:hypothetical protein MTR67_053145 [Solanum verrucosum]